MHKAAETYFINSLIDLKPQDVLEIGSININGSVRNYYPQARSWWGIDIVSGPCVDEVADGATWESTNRYGVAICAEVFEHTPNWRQIIINMHRHLIDGGVLLASCASRDRPEHSGDGAELREGEYYKNVNPDEMHELLSQMNWSYFNIVEADGEFGNDDLYIKCVK